MVSFFSYRIFIRAQNTPRMAEPTAVMIPVNIKALFPAPLARELYIASKVPNSMGMAMVKEGPITIKRGFLGMARTEGGASMAIVSLSRGAMFLGER